MYEKPHSFPFSISFFSKDIFSFPKETHTLKRKTKNNLKIYFHFSFHHQNNKSKQNIFQHKRKMKQRQMHTTQRKNALTSKEYGEIRNKIIDHNK